MHAAFATSMAPMLMVMGIAEIPRSVMTMSRALGVAATASASPMRADEALTTINWTPRKRTTWPGEAPASRSRARAGRRADTTRAVEAPMTASATRPLITMLTDGIISTAAMSSPVTPPASMAVVTLWPKSMHIASTALVMMNARLTPSQVTHDSRRSARPRRIMTRSARCRWSTR